METPLVNRIAKSKLVTIDSTRHYPGAIYDFDLKDYLFQELLLREKEFRASMKEFDWSTLSGKAVYIHCSTDAIVPMWAYMLVTSLATPYADFVHTGSRNEMITSYIIHSVKKIYPPENVEGGKFVIKGCSKFELTPGVYGNMTDYLVKHDARSVMFGEPCSTVPIYKKRKNK